MKKGLLAAVSFLILAGCAPSARTTSVSGPDSLAVFIPGTLQGSPTYELLDQGVRRAAAEVPGTTVKTIEGGFNQAQWGEQIAALAAGGQYRYIVTSNPAMPQIAARAAAAYPRQKFLILESWSKNPSYATLAYNHRELAYLHGVLGGLLAASRHAPPLLGLIAGQDYPDMDNAIVPGFTQGLQSVSPQGKVEFRTVGNWFDAAKSAALAKDLFADGVSVVLPIAGGANQGVVSAAKTAGRSVLWYDTDAYALEPGVIVGCGLVRQDKASYELVKRALAGTLTYGNPQVVGIKEGYIGYATDSDAFRKALPADVQAAFLRVLADFQSGKLHFDMPLPNNG